MNASRPSTSVMVGVPARPSVATIRRCPCGATSQVRRVVDHAQPVAPSSHVGSGQVYSMRCMAQQADPIGVESSIAPDPVIERYKQDIDRTLIRANLQRTPEERLRNLMALQRFADELRAAGRRARER